MLEGNSEVMPLPFSLQGDVLSLRVACSRFLSLAITGRTMFAADGIIFRAIEISEDIFSFLGGKHSAYSACARQQQLYENRRTWQSSIDNAKVNPTPTVLTTPCSTLAQSTHHLKSARREY
jgi:hypothetical protein